MDFNASLGTSDRKLSVTAPGGVLREASRAFQTPFCVTREIQLIELMLLIQVIAREVPGLNLIARLGSARYGQVLGTTVAMTVES